MRKLLLLSLVLCLPYFISAALAQTIPAKGIVISADDDLPIIGATVRVKGTQIATVTDIDGNFDLEIPDSDATLVISFIGFVTQEVKAGPNLKIILSVNSKQLEDVVVVAYGTSKKEALTGSVQAITAKDIETRPLSNVAAALEGMGTGILVNNTGYAGGEPSIRIRGFTSINGNNSPMYVVDGVPYTGNIANFNPNDIENISVLKDATSAALYGSRASNGVILVTTKKGKSGKKDLQFSVSQGIVKRGLSEYDRVGTNDWMETHWLGYRNELNTRDKNPLDIGAANTEASKTLVSDVLGNYNLYGLPADQLFDPNTGKLVNGAKVLPQIAGDLDWYKPMERTGYRQDYNLSGGIGAEGFKAFYSIGYLDEKSYIKNNDFNRLTARLNMNYSPQKWVNIGLSLDGSYMKKYNANEGNNMRNIFAMARNVAPIYPIHLHDLQSGGYILDNSGNKIYDSGKETLPDGTNLLREQMKDRNTIWENELDRDRNKNMILGGQFYAEFILPYGFKASTRNSLNLRNYKNSVYGSPLIGDGKGDGGRFTERSYDYREFWALQQISWNKSFGSHNIDALAAHEFSSWTYKYINNAKKRQVFDNIYELNNFTQVSSASGYTQEYRLESYLGKIRYNYDEKYFFDAAYRRDGNSKFHPNHRWGNFWSLGASWSIFREDFMEEINWVDYLKLRASYGQVANDGGSTFGYYPYLTSYYIDKNSGYGAVYLSNDADPTISWETNNAFNVGFEGRLFDRLNFSFEYFDKKSKDLLMYLYRPLSVGGTSTSSSKASQVRNVGDMSNYGFEIALDMDIIKTRDWTWNLGFDATFLKNKIKRLPAENRKNGIIASPYKRVEGKSMYEFYVYQWAGVDQMNGEALYVFNAEDYDSKGSSVAPTIREIGGKTYTTKYEYAKKDWSGNAIPDVSGAIRTSLKYKDWDLGILCTYSIGGKIFDNSYSGLMDVSRSLSALHKDILGAWKEVPNGMTEDSPNRIKANGIPEINYNTYNYYNTTYSTRNLISRSYFIIKNISLGYSVPKNFTNKLGIPSISLGANMENLAIFTKRKGFYPQQTFGGTTGDDVFMPSRILTFTANFIF